MNYGVSQILLVLSLFSAHLKLLICLLLESMSELVAVLDPRSAYLKACIHLRKFAVNIVEAVHGATSRLKVHNVEFLIQKGEKVDLPKF